MHMAMIMSQTLAMLLREVILIYSGASHSYLSLSLRAYQRLVSSLAIAIPSFDWPSFGWLRHTRNWSGRSLGQFPR